MPQVLRNIPLFFLVTISFFLQLPFLQADPDVLISRSRGPFTDEGLYTLQVRNFINQQGFDINESGSLVKTPFYSLIMLIWLFLFGTNLTAARMIVILISLLTILYIGTKSKLRGVILIFFLLAFSLYPVFHFIHYCVPEMIAISMILFGFYFSFLHFTTGDHEGYSYFKRNKNLILAALFLSLAWYTKIQFLYIAAMLPVFSVVWFIAHRTTQNLSNIAISFLWITAFLIAYAVGWYLPVSDTFNYVMFDQTSDRFPPADIFWNIVEENYNKVFMNDHLQWFTIIWYASILIGTILIFKVRSKTYRFFFLFSLIWMLLEIHKVAIWWVPTRYVISLVLAGGLMISAVIYQLLLVSIQSLTSHEHPSPIGQRLLAGLQLCLTGLIIMFLLFQNSKHYEQSLDRRQYVTKEINTYLSNYDFAHRPILGGWGASFTWTCKARSFPVWHGYLNDRNILDQYLPGIIVSESDEEDSGQAYQKSGIDLETEADSVRTFQLGNWSLHLYWMKN